MKLTLYKGCKIKKNDVVEKTDSYDILSYLGTLENETIENVNLRKRIFNDLTVSVKLNRQLKKIDVYSYNYATIEHEGDIYFYFIADKEWVADSTTNFVLLLDTCNTFEYKNTIISNTDNFRRCNVYREHRDRYTSDRTPIIDKVDEGLGTLPMELKSTKLLGDTKKYYLGYYNAKDENSKSVCKVFTEEGEDHTRSWYNIYKTVNDIVPEESDAALIFTTINDTFYDKNSTPNDYTSSDFWDNKNINITYILHPTAITWIGWTCAYWLTPTTVQFPDQYANIASADTLLDYYSDKPFVILKGKHAGSGTGIQNTTQSLTDLLGDNYTTEVITTTDGLNFMIPAFKDTMKADSNILKIIEIPYLNQATIKPYYDFTFKNVIAGISGDVNESVFTFNSEDLYKVDLPSSLDYVLADKKYETKLMSSQFTTNMFNYDSFNYNLPVENMTIPQTTFDITTYIPSDMSTTVAYRFDYDGVVSNNYDRWLITQRNNQVPTMTNDYLSYMQDGYNYDVKNRNIQTALNWGSWALSGALQGASSGTAFIGGIKAAQATQKMAQWAFADTANAVFKDIAEKSRVGHKFSQREKWENNSAIEKANDQYNNVLQQTNLSQTYSLIQAGQTAGGIASGLISNIASTVQSQEELEKRKKDYLNSASQISNSDDVTLFNIYNEGNKLRFSQYKPREEIEDSIYQVLKLTGYATNQEKIPDLTTRRYYNYIQGDVEFKEGYYIPNVMLADILGSFASGITLFHAYSNEIDLDRKYENWETMFPANLPVKGDIIEMDLGATDYVEGYKNQYRVLNIDEDTGIAEVVALYSAKTITGEQLSSTSYANSTYDTYLNDTWYNSLSDDAKEAIIPKDINSYYYRRPEAKYSEVRGNTSDYQYPSTEERFITHASPSARYDNLPGVNKRLDAETITRNVYLLDLEDVEMYFGGTGGSADENTRGTYSAGDIMETFYNSNFVPRYSAAHDYGTVTNPEAITDRNGIWSSDNGYSFVMRSSIGGTTALMDPDAIYRMAIIGLNEKIAPAFQINLRKGKVNYSIVQEDETKHLLDPIITNVKSTTKYGTKTITVTFDVYNPNDVDVTFNWWRWTASFVLYYHGGSGSVTVKAGETYAFTESISAMYATSIVDGTGTMAYETSFTTSDKCNKHCVCFNTTVTDPTYNPTTIETESTGVYYMGISKTYAYDTQVTYKFGVRDGQERSVLWVEGGDKGGDNMLWGNPKYKVSSVTPTHTMDIYWNNFPGLKKQKIAVKELIAENRVLEEPLIALVEITRPALNTPKITLSSSTTESATVSISANNYYYQEDIRIYYAFDDDPYQYIDGTSSSATNLTITKSHAFSGDTMTVKAYAVIGSGEGEEQTAVATLTITRPTE